MNDSGKRRRTIVTGLATALVAALLAGCATQGGLEETTRSFLVTPGKYSLYSCPQLAVRVAAVEPRKRELEALIAKADTGPGGAIAATLAYRTEYAQVRGELAELAKESAAKNCPPPAPTPAAMPRPPKPKKGKPARG